MTTQFELTEEFLNILRQGIEKQDKEGVNQLIAELHPADLADIIEELDLEEAQFVFLLLDDEMASDTLAELEEEERDRFIASFPSEIIARRFIDNMESDDAADVVGSLTDEQQQEVLSHIEDIDQAGDIVELLHYDEDTAGGMMAKEYVKVNMNWTVLTCLKELSRQAEEVDEIYYVYVVDDDDILKGRLSLKTMILSPTSTKIDSIFDPEVPSVRTDEPAESVGLIMQKYDLIAIPVIDSIGRLVGRITIDDAVDVIRDEAEKDYQMMSGISHDVEASDSVWRQFRARIPWLIIGLLGGILAAYMISLYEDIIIPITSMFIPIITAMGGNVGIQSSAIVVQGLASNTYGASNIWRNLLREFGVALLNAVICATIVFGFTLMFKGMTPEGMSIFALPVTVAFSLFAVVVFSSLFGTAFPLLLDKLHVDPAVATGPFITVTNDIIGLNIYLLIGRFLLSSFGG